MTIQIHLPFSSEAEAYRASSDDMSAVYDGPIARSYSQATDRETAIQIARAAHYASAREYLGDLGLEDETDADGNAVAPAPHVGLNVEGLLRANRYDV